MHENNSTAQDLWTRQIGGERLSGPEQQHLLHGMSSDDGLRRRIARDESTHRMLQAIAPLEDDRAWFTHSVLERCEQGWKQTPDVVGVSVQPPPVESTVDPASVVAQEEMPVIPHPLRASRNGASKSKSRGRLMRMSVVAASVAMIFSAGWLAGVSSKKGQLTKESTRSASTPRENSGVSFQDWKLQRDHKTGFATLASSPFSRRNEPRIEGRRIAKETIELQQGEYVIALDNGSRLRVMAPAKLRLVSADEVSVNHGKVLASVPASVDGLRVVTPTSHVVDQGSDYELVVNMHGDTDVLVNSGNLMVLPWPNSSVQPEPMVLTTNSTNRATVFEPMVTDSQQGPLASSTHGREEGFSGVISVNGQSVEFTSPEAFESARKRVNDRFRVSTGRFHEEWNKTLKQFQGAAAAGSLSLNGRNHGFNGIDEIIALQQRMLKEAKAANRDMSKLETGSFRGTININGETRTFDSPEEFDKAQREAFGPLETLGIDVFDIPKLRQMMDPRRPEEEADSEPVQRESDDESAQQTSLPMNQVYAL